MYEGFACMYVCVPHACLEPKKARRGHQIHGPEGTDSCDLPCECWKWNRGRRSSGRAASAIHQSHLCRPQLAFSTGFLSSVLELKVKGAKLEGKALVWRPRQQHRWGCHRGRDSAIAVCEKWQGLIQQGWREFEI